MTRSVRTLLLVAAGLVLLAGIPLFVFPLRTADWFAWTVASPMTAVFLGASYWASAVLEVGGARARTWPQGRISVPAVMVFTTLTLVATLLHLPLFHLGADQAAQTRAVAWGWLVVYAVVPVAMLVLLVRQRRAGADEGVRTARLPGWVRLLLVAARDRAGGRGCGALAGTGQRRVVGLGAHPAHGARRRCVADRAGGRGRARPGGGRRRAGAPAGRDLAGVRRAARARAGAVRRRGGLDDAGRVGYLVVLACLLLLGLWAVRAPVAAPARAAAVAG